MEVASPGVAVHSATKVLGSFLRDVIAQNPNTFRLFGPDETSSNRLQDVFEVTNRTWDAELQPGTTTCTRRPGHGGAVGAPVPGLAGGLPADRTDTACSPATRASSTFVDSMFNQHAKWMEVAPGTLAPTHRLLQLFFSSTMFGAKTTTASRTRTPASSTSS